MRARKNKILTMRNAITSNMKPIAAIADYKDLCLEDVSFLVETTELGQWVKTVISFKADS